MLVGYCRVSIADDRQTTDLQQDALSNIGIDKRNIYEDRASGSKTTVPVSSLALITSLKEIFLLYGGLTALDVH